VSPTVGIIGEGSLMIVVISKEGVYIVTAVVVAAARVESRLIAAVVVVLDASKSIVSLSNAAMSLMNINGLLVIGYG